MEQDIKISIVIPYYNGKDCICACVKALDNLTHNHQIIIVDDGSNESDATFLDNTFDSCHEIKIYHKSNGGIANARNFGIQKSSGTFLLFIDQDDRPVAEIIDKAANVCEQKKADIAVWTTKQETGDTCLPCDTVKVNATVNRKIIESEIIPSYISKTENSYVTSMAHVWGALFRREVIVNKKLLFRKFVAFEDDYLFLLDTLLEAGTIIFLRDTGYYWKRDHQSESSTLRYIPDIWNRYKMLYSYVYSQCESHGIVIPNRMKLYVRQSVSIRTLENCGSVKNPNRKKELKELRQNLENPVIQDAFQQDSVRKYTGRSHRLFMLIRNKKYFIAEEYVYADSIRQSMKNKLKSLLKR